VFPSPTGETEERITAVASWRDALYFTDAERVALELVEAALTPNPSGERVSDELFVRASVHYDTKALRTLTLAIGRPWPQRSWARPRRLR
jgi:alkylhydroperoxidase family enzyme